MERSRPFHTTARWILAVVAVAALVAIAVLLYQLRPTPIAETKVQEVVVATIQKEAPASFFVTGTLELSATSTIRHTRFQHVMPYLPPANLGTTSAEARLPGTVAYGFDVRELKPEHIRLGDDGVVHVSLPPLRVFSAEPDLQAMHVASEQEWRAWLMRHDERAAERDALQAAQRALRTQATHHLKTAREPQLHSAEALRLLLSPALKAAGLSAPVFRMEMGGGLVYEVREGAEGRALPAPQTDHK